MRLKKKKKEERERGREGEERFWALCKREQTEGPRRVWNSTTGSNALSDTKDPGLVSRAYFGWWK